MLLTCESVDRDEYVTLPASEKAGHWLRACFAWHDGKPPGSGTRNQQYGLTASPVIGFQSARDLRVV